MAVASCLFASAVLIAAGATVRAGQRRAIEPAVAIAPPSSRAQPQVRADGRVVASRGGQVTVGAEMAGTVERVLVEEGAVVRAGETLAVFRASEGIAALREANARAREAAATARFLEEETRRTKGLVDSGSLPRRALNEIQSHRDAARAGRAAAIAASARLAAGVARARLTAPIAGTVVARKVEPGETVAMGAPLFVVADLTHLRVEAEVDEFDALRVRPSMKASVTADGWDGAPLDGTVSDVGLFVSPRGIRPQDPARPLDAQVLKVKIELPGAALPLKLGQRVSVTLSARADDSGV
jgi:HlyD family secretion protein